MTTTATKTTTYTHRPHRVRCQLCGDTGVVTEEDRAPIGRASNGELVYSSRPKVYRYACICRAGWPKVSAR